MDTPNPFNITKAVDLTDDEIYQYWVDIAGSDGFAGMVKPRSPMPMLILGGKGSGKTHLMRFLSYALQKIRHPDDVARGVQADGYLGVYFRCTGLNSGRFSGKGQSADVWASVFEYYLELWIAQLLLSIVDDLVSGIAATEESQRAVCRVTRGLFDEPPDPFPDDLRSLREMLAALQREVDIAVNNSGLTQQLTVRVRVTRGRLVFGLPRALGAEVLALRDVRIVYLVDEFENLTEDQQRYVNTLLREKEGPCTFKIGARLYGVRTYSTYSADEENKEGSEFETLHLDDILRAQGQYPEFARELCMKRLEAAGYLLRGNRNSAGSQSLDESFAALRIDPFGEAETSNIVRKYEGRERPYFKSLRRKLSLLADGQADFRSDDRTIGRIIDRLRCPPYPLLEKLNVFLLYRAWYRRLDLTVQSRSIGVQCKTHLADPRAESDYGQVFDHFRNDLLAQLLRECDMKQRYLGFAAFVDMSDGLPRNLLITLKHIFGWAVFNGEEPFKQSPISIESQQSGVREASEWFFRDARAEGPDGRLIRESVERLAELFREIRYSDKPTECSLCAFSTKLAAASPEAQRIVDLAEKWSLLIWVPGGQRDRNTKRIDVKYQLNPMLAPRWDLPVSRRGAIVLSPQEADAIFDSTRSGDLDELVRTRVALMTAPQFGRSTRRRRQADQTQSELFSD